MLSGSLFRYVLRGLTVSEILENDTFGNLASRCPREFIKFMKLPRNLV